MTKLTIVESKKPTLSGELRTQKNIYDENGTQFVAIINDAMPLHLQEFYTNLFVNSPQLLSALEELTNVDILNDHAVFKAQQIAHRTLSLFKK